jgi:predicted RNA-binding protein YlxR (DUF448 family)/ribosomal protein L30E
MVRTCVGCRAEGSPAELVRVVVGPDGGVVPDLAGGAFGRGAWLHPRPDCVRKAVPRGLSHALKVRVATDAQALFGLMSSAAERRAAALLRAAERARKAALGATAVAEAEAAGSASLFVVAADAESAGRLPSVAAAVKSGRAVVFGTKATLGALFGREQLGVLAILDPGLAEAVARAVRLSELERSSGRSPSLAMSEVG